ncbi:MAG: hypothetical protein KF852_17945 [Saprospiraceae bacterium]|nr:hypothetical protein [Saprospiraceae bacterium]
MSTEHNTRVMIVVWRWIDANKIGVSQTDWQDGVWRSSNGNALVRLDLREQTGRADFLLDLITKNFSDCEVALFLHQNHPHNFEESERIDIQNQLNKAQIKARPIFFYGGDEPIYFSHNPLGILGINGDFPTIKIDGTNVIQSDFIEDPSKKRINQKHFDFVWDFYWYGRRNRILELSETLRIRFFDYLKTRNPVGAFLRQETETKLGDKLLSFTLTEPDEEAPAIEYDMRPYLTYFKYKKQEDYSSVAESMSKVQQRVKTLLNSTAVDKDAETEMDTVYREITALYVSLPEYTQ